MCIDKIIDIFVNFLSTILAVIVGAILAYWFSKRLFEESRRVNALTEFVNSFIDTKIFIENYHPITKDGPKNTVLISFGKSLHESLIGFRDSHRRAIEVFRHYISKEKYEKIYKEYENYYNPRNQEGTPETIHILSFSVYDSTKKEIKKLFNKNISGKEFALENINRILDAAYE